MTHHKVQVCSERSEPPKAAMPPDVRKGFAFPVYHDLRIVARLSLATMI
jgi:hypothetical protein